MLYLKKNPYDIMKLQIDEKGIFRRWDIVATYLFLKEYLNHTDSGVYFELMTLCWLIINNRRQSWEMSEFMIEDAILKYQMLIDSILKTGSAQISVILNKNGYIKDGMHRLAISLYFGVFPAVIIDQQAGNCWGHNLEDYIGLSKTGIGDKLIEGYKEIKNKWE